jgi:Aldehyde dehydrogenase family
MPDNVAALGPGRGDVGRQRRVRGGPAAGERFGGGQHLRGVAQLGDTSPEAVAGAANAIFFSHGQCCVAGSRLFVQQNRFDEVVAGVVEIAKSIKLGPGMEEGTQMGPLVSDEQLRRVTGGFPAPRPGVRKRPHPGPGPAGSSHLRITSGPFRDRFVRISGRKVIHRWLTGPEPQNGEGVPRHRPPLAVHRAPAGA